MTEKRYQIIHLGNPYDFVVKDHQTNRTYGTLQGDSKSLQECLDNLIDENEQLKLRIKELELLNDGLNYALTNIKKIDVEIDLNEWGDVE